MEMPKNQEAFECLMKKRAEEAKWCGPRRRKFYFIIDCDEAGNPIGEGAKAFCEASKMVLGTQNAYIECSVLEKNKMPNGSWRIRRTAIVNDPNDELRFYDDDETAIFIKTVFNVKGNKKKIIQSVSGGPTISGGSFCSSGGIC
jgi:hypothetical protein